MRNVASMAVAVIEAATVDCGYCGRPIEDWRNGRLVYRAGFVFCSEADAALLGTLPAVEIGWTADGMELS